MNILVKSVSMLGLRLGLGLGLGLRLCYVSTPRPSRSVYISSISFSRRTDVGDRAMTSTLVQLWSNIQNPKPFPFGILSAYHEI